jgi:gamma-glutamylcyclotransferase (GGCT)/AIG2-like uncharacterized protein YtfP
MDVLLAVNGGLMRGMSSHQVMLDAGAVFLREDATEPAYRLWSIDDQFPAMLRVAEGGASIVVEVYELSTRGFTAVLQREPAGLSVAHVRLIGGEILLGVVAEQILCEHRREITEYGGWRAYRESLD